MKVADTPEFFTAKEVAARWKVSPATVYRAINSGELTALRIGGSVRVALSTVETIEQQGMPLPEVA
jgi:excisionase family DNA binding protein